MGPSPLGPRAQDVAGELRAELRSDTALQVSGGLGRLDIVARLLPGVRMAQADKLRLSIPGPGGAPLPAAAVADVTAGRGYVTINRVVGSRTVAMQARSTPMSPTRAI